MFAHMIGPEFFSKEILQFSGYMYALAIGENILRIEYGSLANDKKIYSKYFNLAENNLNIGRGAIFDMEKNNKELTGKFLSGDCVGLNAKSIEDENQMEYFLCEVCLMHQYGLHRTKDNIRQICEGGKNPNGGKKNCFWTKPSNNPPKFNGVKPASNLANINVDVSKLCNPGDVTDPTINNLNLPETQDYSSNALDDTPQEVYKQKQYSIRRVADSPNIKSIVLFYKLLSLMKLYVLS